jgi:beta-lactamase class A
MLRREFLVGLGATAAASLPLAAHASEVFHVVYLGTDTLEAAQEHGARLAVQLGPTVGEQLRVVRHGDRYVNIYDRSEVKHPADASAAKRVADAHDRLLRRVMDSDRPMAGVLAASDIRVTWDIRYGEPGSLEGLRASWETVATMLGSGVAKQLVIEQVGDTHRLVYKRAGDEASTRRVATRHAELLASTSLSATAVRDAWAQVVHDGSTDDKVAAVAADERATPAPVAVTRSTMDLSKEINAHIQDYRKRGLVSSVERTSWIVQDLRDDRILAAINADTPRQAASMIKPWVALAFLHEVDRGRFVYGPKSQRHMERMIRDSSNPSTNWFMEQIGGPRSTEAILRKQYPRLARSVSLVEYIPGDGRTYRNKVSVAGHAALLRALWHNDIPGAKELRRAMNLPGADRIYHGVPNIPVGTSVYNKTGTTAMCCGDMGILVARTAGGARVPYSIVAVIERTRRTTSYTSWVHARGDVIRSVSGLVYEALKREHGLV